jgi:tetratricopeptide (TPR) repeat protein
MANCGCETSSKKRTPTWTHGNDSVKKLLPARHFVIRNSQFVIALAFHLLVAGCAVQNPPSPSPDQQWKQVRAGIKLRQAAQHYRAGLFDECIKTGMEAIVLDPSRPEAYVLVGRAHLELGRSAAAGQLIAAASAAGLDTADLRYTEGVVLEQEGKTEEALKSYQRAIELTPGRVDALMAWVECLVELGHVDEAWEVVSRQSAGHEGRGAIAALTGHVATLAGHPDEAVRLWTEAVSLVGDDPVLAAELGLLLMRLERWEQAISVLRPLIRTDGDLPPQGTIRRALASCYLQVGEPARAVTTLGEYVAVQPDDAAAQLILAKAALACGDTALASQSLEAAKRRTPENSEILFVQAALNWRKGNLDFAFRDLNTVLQRSPNDVDARCLLGEVLLAQGRVEAAREQFETALETDADCAWARAALPPS